MRTARVADLDQEGQARHGVDAGQQDVEHAPHLPPHHRELQVEEGPGTESQCRERKLEIVVQRERA
jgi:hypothetical protein